jgi:ubiquinone/menaquinone biosynthesis C-methylase UbiE
MSHGDRVFHHSEAARLDSPERLTWLPPTEIIKALRVRPGMTVADIGAGTGYFSIPLAEAVSHSGHVFAVDLQREMLAFIEQKLTRRSDTLPISLHHGTSSNTTLADHSCDIVFLANVWHEIDDIGAALLECTRIAAPGGILEILDWRKDLTAPPGPPGNHRIGVDRVMKDLAAAGWQNVEGSFVGMYSHLVRATAPW